MRTRGFLGATTTRCTSFDGFFTDGGIATSWWILWTRGWTRRPWRPFWLLWLLLQEWFKVLLLVSEVVHLVYKEIYLVFRWTVLFYEALFVSDWMENLDCIWLLMMRCIISINFLFRLSWNQTNGLDATSTRKHRLVLKEIPSWRLKIIILSYDRMLWLRSVQVVTLLLLLLMRWILCKCDVFLVACFTSWIINDWLCIHLIIDSSWIILLI